MLGVGCIGLSGDIYDTGEKRLAVDVVMGNATPTVNEDGTYTYSVSTMEGEYARTFDGVNHITSTSDGLDGEFHIKYNTQGEEIIGNFSMNGEELHTIDNSKNGEITSAILKGSTKYRDIDTGEILDVFEDGRNLELVSGKMPVLTTTGKNLFDGKLELGELNPQNGTINNALNYDRRHRSVNYIPVKSNTNYIYSCNVGDSGCNWMWYDKDKKYIKTSEYRITATSPSNANYLKYFSGMPQGTNLSTLKVQIEESSTTTPFEPHKSNILTANEDVTLRSNGDICD